MGRDLGQFREQPLQHRTDDMEFHDDALIVKLNGPSTPAKFAGVAQDARVEVTPLIRARASLWRGTFGSRHGRANLKEIAAAQLARQWTPGTFAGAARGILGAARLAVADARQGRRTGAGTAQSALWNKSISAFQNRSQHNIPGTTQARLRSCGAFINPAGVQLRVARACKAQPLARTQQHRKVATHRRGRCSSQRLPPSCWAAPLFGS